MKGLKVCYIFVWIGLYMVVSVHAAYCQKKKLTETAFFKKFLSSEKDSSRSAHFIALPVLSYSQETAWEYGVNGNYSFYADKRDTTIYSSSINVLAALTTKHQGNLKATTDVWSHRNLYHYTGELRYRHYPFHFYGIGNNTRQSDQDILIESRFRFQAEVEKKIVDRFYTGINLRFENFQYKDKEADGIFEKESFYGASGGRYLAIGVSQAFDSRNSNTYTTQGTLAKVKLAYAPDFWRQNHFTGGLAEADIRFFTPLGSKTTLGFNGIYQTVISAETPFYLLPQLGNDEMMRGYYQGRYRDKNMAAIQSEVRYRIHPRIGLALFAAAGSVFPNLQALRSIKVSYGGGISYFFDIEHQSSVRIDYGAGEKRIGEKRQNGFYIALGQAF